MGCVANGLLRGEGVLLPSLASNEVGEGCKNLRDWAAAAAVELAAQYWSVSTADGTR